jgi:phenylpyruvate tautomerase PptA (4-oxalocrotonate tautomerase family)
MPLYSVSHSYPLTRYQKDQLAEKITYLHSREYLTPSLFVNVMFREAEPTGDFYLAGKPYNGGVTSPNVIRATVRMSPKRTKERFDAFGERIQAAWDEVVNGPREAGYANGTNGHHGELSKAEKRARKLHIVGFEGVITGLENGVTLPSVSLLPLCCPSS